MVTPVVLGFNDKRPSDRFLKTIEKYSPYGIIFFERNFNGLDMIVDNVKSIRSASPNSSIMIDEEGGMKSRIRREHGFPNPPDPREVADEMSLDDAREAYRILGRALLELGIDVDLAPVVDVAPKEHILGDRSFSDDWRICADYSEAVINGLHDGGVLTCAKHFPGLGSAEIDPHLEATVSDAKREEFERKHFPPFKRSIEAGVDFIMTTHMRSAALDPLNSIATLSTDITKLIREMGFVGKILTDDLLMGGAASIASIGELSRRAINAGHDVVLICRELENIEIILEELVNSV